MVKHFVAVMFYPFNNSSPTSVLEHYKIYRAWEKDGCMFIKRGSETERHGEWIHVVRSQDIFFESGNAEVSV